MAEVIAQATGIILAGGESSRFGSNKALALWNGGEKLVERVCSLMSSLFARNLVLVKDPARFSFLQSPGFGVVGDLFPEAHSLGGLCSGLHHAPTDMVFVCGCDMPHLQPGLVRAMWEARTGYDAVVPVWQGRLQPMCGFYSKSCLGVLRIMARENRLKIQELFGIVRTRFFQEREVRAFDAQGLSFCDVDTPEDFLAAQAAA